MRALAVDEHGAEFWVRHVRIGVALSVGTVLAALVYLGMTWDRPGRASIAAVLVISLLLTACLPLMPLRRLVRHPRGILFLYGWSAVICLMIAAGTALDGGAASPLKFLYILPLVYGAIAYPPLAVLVMGCGVIGLSVIDGLGDDAANGSQFLFAATLALVSAMCAVTARNHWDAFEQQARLAQRLAALAHEDGLSGCLNHRTFHERLHAEAERAARYARPLTLLMVDLDDFKGVNDTHGHPAGDRLLSQVGQVLHGAARAPDVIGRVGGDEFAVLLPETLLADGLVVAERIASHLAEITDPCRLTASIGVSAMPEPATDARSLLDQADTAIYRAKRGGRNAIAVFGTEFDELPSAPAMTGSDLALQRRVKELIIADQIAAAFQPVISLTDGAVFGYEALARVRGSVVGPDRWLDIADQVGLRDALEVAMWAAALAHGPPPANAVLFLNAGSAALASGALRGCRGLLPEHVAIEMSGPLMAADYAAFGSRLRDWASAGVQVAVDDVGPGYGDARQLLDLAPNFLKLDRSLVAGIDASASRQGVVVALLQLADRGGCQVIAEGVETQAEATTLADLGVPLAQGYLFARPGPAWPQVTWQPAMPIRHLETAAD